MLSIAEWQISGRQHTFDRTFVGEDRCPAWSRKMSNEPFPLTILRQCVLVLRELEFLPSEVSEF